MAAEGGAPAAVSKSDPAAALAAALEPHGLILRGGFSLRPDDHEGEGVLLMVGNAGGAMWAAFQRDGHTGANPLDAWTRRVIAPLAERFGARAIYPFDRPHPPIQRWAKRAEGLGASPLGLLIHPRYGLWHAYRAALVFPPSVMPEPPVTPSAPVPCEKCVEKPCLSACPVNAFSPAGYDVPACASYLSDAKVDCHYDGCAARNACPVGTDSRYPEAQIRFHMKAFSRTVS